jgi:hypothetical protein
MQKTGAKGVFLLTLFLTASVAWMPASASLTGLKLQTGTPSQPLPKPSAPGPSAPDGGAPFPCAPGSVCPS